MTDLISAQNLISPIVVEPVSTIPILDFVSVTTPDPNSVILHTSSLPITESQSPSGDVSMPSTDLVPSSPIVPTADIIPSSPIVPSANVVPLALNPPLRRSQRASKPPAYLQSNVQLSYF
nr:hypothetical protein CFP56_62255 [Quercus suber]